MSGVLVLIADDSAEVGNALSLVDVPRSGV